MSEERKAFEEWAKAQGNHLVRYPNTGNYAGDTHEAWESWQAATRHRHEQTAQGDHQPDDISDEEESVWQIINSELAKLNLIGKARTDAADAIWEKIGPFIHKAVDVEKIARMTCEPAWEKLSPKVQQHKLELARDAIAAMGFTPIYTKRGSSALPDHIAQAIACAVEALEFYTIIDAKRGIVGTDCPAVIALANLLAIQEGGDE